MARNGSGVYSLPSGYEATTGQTATATQHNSPLEDIANDLNAARPVVAGGTGATTASGARTNLGVPATADVQPVNANLTSLAGLTFAANKGLYTTAANTAALFDLTAAGLALLDDADAAAQRTTLGLGNIATTDLIDEDDMASDTAAQAPSQQSVKAYVDLRLPIAPGYDSGNLSWTAGAAISPLTHGLGGVPSRWEAYLICKSANNDWAVGDRVKVGDYFSNGGSIYNMTIAANATQIKGVVGASGIVIHHATSAGAVTALTTEWDLRIFAWA